MWGLKTAPKVKMLVWKALKGALPVGMRLAERFVPAEKDCKRCGRPESITHLFIQCPYAQEVWEAVPFTSGIDNSGDLDLDTFWNDVKHMICLPPTGIVAGQLAPWIMWELWTARNKFVFTGRTTTPMESLSRAVAAGREWQNGQEQPKVQQQRKRKEPEIGSPNMAVMRSDAAWRTPHMPAGLGWTLDIMDEDTRKFAVRENWVSSPLMGEAIALLTGLLKCRELNIQEVRCEAHSSLLINSIKNGNNLPEIYGVVADILCLVSDFSLVSFIWIAREKNRQADELAKQILDVNEVFMTST